MRKDARITVRLKPRSSKDAVEGWRDGVLQVRLTSPPLEGAANRSLVSLLSKKLGVAKGDVRIVSGARSRSKIVKIEGLSLEEVERRFL